MALLIMLSVVVVLGLAVILRCRKVEKDTAYLNDIYYKADDERDTTK